MGALMAKIERVSAIAVAGLQAAFDEMGISADVKRFVLTREWTLSEIPPIGSDAECGIYQRRRETYAPPDPHSDFDAWAVWFKTPAGIQACALDVRIIEWLQGGRESVQDDAITSSYQLHL